MPRNLKLTEKQETDLLVFLKRRLVELDSENKDRIDADKASDKAYENDVSARATPGSLYSESNMPIPLTPTVVDHFQARSENELFDRKPLAHFKPEGPADEDSARGLDRFAGYRLFKVAGTDQSLLDCSHTLFRHRAQILKATFHEDIDQWEEHGLSILHAVKDNEPVIIENHGFVVEGREKWLDVIDPLTGKGVQVLEVDPTVVLDENLYFWAPAKAPIRFKNVNYSGPKSREVDSDCFRAPTSCRCLDDADTIAEYYDKPAWWIRDRFLDRPWLTWDKYRNRVRKANASRKTEDERKRMAKEARAFDLEESSVGIVEVWLKRDVLGWGTPQRIVVWYDKANDTLIDYEFWRLVTPDGNHPYTAIAVAKTKGFWWGKSIPEILAPFQEYVDKQWNRHSFRNAINANPIIAQNPDAIVEKKSFRDLMPFEVVTLEANRTVADWIQAFAFPNADTDTQDLIDKAIYWVNFWLGISNIARGDYSDVPQNTTLGGQEATLKESGKLGKRWTRRVVEGYGDHLTKLARILVATMDPQEAYVYLEGDREQVGFITSDSVRDMELNARIVIGTDNTTQRLQERQMTLQLVTQYLTYPPQIQQIVRPVMKQLLFDLGNDNVDELLPVPMMPVVDPMTGQTVMAPLPSGPVPPQSAPDTSAQVPQEAAPQPAAAPAPQPLAVNA